MPNTDKAKSHFLVSCWFTYKDTKHSQGYKSRRWCTITTLNHNSCFNYIFANFVFVLIWFCLLISPLRSFVWKPSLDECREEMFGVEGRMTMISNSETGSIGNNNSPHHTSTFTNVTNHTHHQFSSRTESVGSNNITKVVTSAPASRSTSLDPSRLSIISDAVDGRGSVSQLHGSPTSDSYETLDLTDSLKRLFYFCLVVVTLVYLSFFWYGSSLCSGQRLA